MISHAEEGDDKRTIVGGTDGARYGDKVVITIDWCRLAVDVQLCCSINSNEATDSGGVIAAAGQVTVVFAGDTVVY